jgi:hypothetical protein
MESESIGEVIIEECAYCDRFAFGEGALSQCGICHKKFCMNCDCACPAPDDEAEEDDETQVQRHTQ